MPIISVNISISNHSFMEEESREKTSVQYFAALREQSGKDQETLVTDSQRWGSLSISSKELWLYSRARFAVMCDQRSVQTDESSPTDGDRVVFIPPVAGG